jgi:endonuclease/exonuclease/phosphatase (EEP) superfamily protein YafD
LEEVALHSTHRLSHAAKTLLRLSGAVYIVMMVGYLILRVAFGDGTWWLSFLNASAHLLFLPLLVLFPLALIFDKPNALRLFPLLFIAVVLYAPYFFPKEADIVEHSPLHILTFNVWGDNPQLEVFEQWVKESHADIVFLQEIPEQYSREGFSRLLDLYPYQQVQSLDMRVWGNAVLSRHPFLETEDFDLEGDGTPSHQRETLDWDGQVIAVYNIHLVMPIGEQAHLSLPIENPFLNLALKYDDTLRNEEIRRLLERLEKETYPFLVAGDFNTSDQSVIYSRLAVQMKDTYREIGSGFGGSWPLPIAGEFPSFIPPLFRVDYLWHSSQFRALDAHQGPPLGSDHLGLVATLSLIE